MTPEEQIAELRPLLGIIVRERIGTQSWLRDDAEQEAMIAAWTRLEQGLSVGIAVHNAKQAVIDVVRGHRATGSKRSGGIVDSHTKSSSIFRAAVDGDEYVIEPADHQAERAYDQIDLAETLHGAMECLSDRDREIVQAVFYEDLRHADVAQRFGLSRQAVSQRLHRIYDTLRPALAEAG